MQEKIIILGEINKKLLLPLILTLVQILYNIFNKFYPEKNISGIIPMYSYSFSAMSVRLLPFILKISNKETVKENEFKKKKCLHYFLLCLFTFINNSVKIFGEMMINNLKGKIKSDININITNIFPINNFIILGFETIFLIIISILLLKYKYYKHHIISIIIFIALGIVSDVVLNNYEKFDSNFFLIQFIGIIEAGADSLFYCYQKYMMEKYYYPYWNICFVTGIFNFFVSNFYLISFLNDKDKEKSSSYLVYSFYSYFNGEDIGLKIGKIIIIFLIYIIIQPLIILILFYFRPNFLLIILQLSYITQNLMDISANKLYCIIFYIIQFFALMLHLEILELNLCGLNENTRKNISIRSVIDILDDDCDSSAGNNIVDINNEYSIDIREKNEKNNEMIFLGHEQAQETSN